MKDEINPKLMLNCIDNSLLLKVANGKIDIHKLIKDRLIEQGIDKNGKYVGQISAKKHWLSKNKLFSEIAKKILLLKTLRERKCDSLDYHELGVTQIKRALNAAYKGIIE